ncbi:zymogen granule membrane protein 16-like [Boleophthalmus pectinirostris]|uniref:zymogen granule membrane protein 16 n=1 Tax=Boleophthalmus pectinirostris TaxID=150288 RepID=UPI00242FCB2B|nr:zymogen granule membrane protein 16 [Boleophthalmus pectinirostris]XP_055013620.1 zymogen granule membrane protein 16-like [Boleophthalmus pectinirostris]
MHSFILVALLAGSALLASAAVIPPFSYSDYAGSNSGIHFTLDGEPDQRLTSIRIWDNNGAYINGIQFSFGKIWGDRIGYPNGRILEIDLDTDNNEAIIQISGKYSRYLNWLVFVTNKGRFFYAGTPSGISFNMYPGYPGMELRAISGTLHGALTGIAVHWAMPPPPSSDSNEH